MMSPPPSPHPAPAPGTDEVADDDLAHGVVSTLRLRHPGVRRGVAVALGVLAAVCLLAVATRASAWPLVPLLPLVGAGYGALRARSAARDRRLLAWGSLTAVGVALGLWSMSFIARTFL